MMQFKRSRPVRRKAAFVAVRFGRLAAAVTLVALTAVPLAAAKEEKRLPAEYQQWLEDVEFIILKNERKAFLALDKDHQRDSFIRRFWQSRDPDPETPDNRFKGQYLVRLQEARELYPSQRDERRKVHTFNGEPSSIEETDCGLLLWPVQLWTYGYSEHARGQLKLFFYQPGGAGPFRLWRPLEGYSVLVRFVARQNTTSADFWQLMRDRCTEVRDDIERLLFEFRQFEMTGEMDIQAANDLPNLDPEWLGTFKAFSTDVEPDREQFEAGLTFEFPGLHQQRVIVRATLEVPRAKAEVVELAGRRSYNFSLTGEILRDRELFESFKYVFDVPEAEAGGAELPLVFERWLRAGSYRMVLKLEDIHGGGASRLERELTVPQPSELGGISVALGPRPSEGEGEVEAEAVPVSLQLVAEGKDLQRGYARFAARVDGRGVAKVRFYLEDRPILTKTRPPFSVELDLGQLPETMTVRAVALDASDRELATDALLLNPGEYGFSISLIEPQWGSRHSGAVAARANVETPEGSLLERVEFYRDDQRVAALFQEPFTTSIPLLHDDLVVVRVVALLEDGNMTEDVAILNGADYLEKIDVRMIEVFASVLDGRGLPLPELAREEFRILENGEEQQILRFEHLDNLPIYAGLLIDTSASMAERMEPVRDAAVRFFERAMRPQDRAAVVTFADRPRLATGFTSDLDRLTGALAGIKAGEGTALYDSILFALYNFRGLKGQRALLILSDGEDRRSKATFEEAREFALASGVTLYTIGVEKGMTRRGKAELHRLAEETGGRAFLIDTVAELEAIYKTIQTDLRSKYFLAYQPVPSDDRAFRTVEVRVARPGAEVRALRGYVPR